MMMTNQEIIEQFKTLIKSRVQPGSVATIGFIDKIKDECISLLKLIYPGMDKDEKMLEAIYETARSEYLSVYPVDINPSSTLTSRDLKMWLTEERKRQMPTDYIDRYVAYLRKSARPERIIQEVLRSSERILGNLGDPKSESAFFVKGLVVGNVQSGKTGNFNAVINRAIDAGYSLIIVLSGIMEDLRSQTQLRIESDVIGEGVTDLLKNLKGDKGVGKVRKFGEQGDHSVRQIFSVTSYRQDFVKTVKESDFSLNNKNILICKKNTGVLKNLLLWLNDYLSENREKHSIPLLIIDDEADNASLNNLGHLGREYSSTINGHIRALLNLFNRKSYLGYTATPFANVLQDRNEEATGKWKIISKEDGVAIAKEFSQVNNIFPEDFIELLSPPSNYIGAKQIFETVLDPDVRKIPLVFPIDDCFDDFPTAVVENPDGTTRPVSADDLEDGDLKIRSSRRDDNYPKVLPESLREAIRCFVLSIALRLTRKPLMVNSQLYMSHHTMLVHVSRFIPWQTRTKNLISEYVREVAEKIENDLPSAMDSVYALLEQTWNRHYVSIVANIRSYLPDDYSDEFLVPKTFNDIKPFLIDAVKGIETKAINSETGDKLLYTEDASRNGRKFIAVGGNRLSRGFTLEGLSVNYFLRDTNFSDTLLQMGRWFGYRPGYLDCCRLFTTSDSIEKFDLTTRTIEELEMEFRKMERDNKTPRDFILRVRKHPGVLKITRPSILRNTEEVNWSYQDKLVQTTSFYLNPISISNAWKDLKNFFNTYRQSLEISEGFFRINTDHNGLLNLLDLRNSFDKSYNADLLNIKTFVRRCIEQRKLENWVIAIKRKGDAGLLREDVSGLPGVVKMAKRRGPENSFLRARFINENHFSASGRSANIVTSGSDFSILLSDEERRKAEDEFKKERLEFYLKSKKLPEIEAKDKVAGITFPERIYRERIPDTTGLIIIYLIDLHYVFLQEPGRIDDELKKKIEKEGFDLEIPLVGFAIGFPPIEPDPGGTYAKGKYDLSDEGATEEPDDLLKEIDE